MPSRKVWLAGLVIVALGAPPLRAQVPGLPGGAGAGVPTGGAAGAIPGAASGLGTSGLTSAAPTGFCANLSACVQKCMARFCASQMGQMMGSLATGPMASMTGGFLPSLCPPPGTIPPGGAGSPAGSAASTASAIQASEANAKARVAAMEYLGTVDCTRWPEAKSALINGLRQDTNECVRFAAARALNSGCCCDKKVIDALRICVAGETSDGAPAENSVRVKAAAFSALQNCLMKVPEGPLPPEPPPPEGDRPQPPVPLPPPGPERTTQRPVANPHIATSYNPPRRGPITYEDRLQHKTFSQTVDEARRTLFHVSQTPRPPATVPAGQRSLFGSLARARNEINAANLRRAREQGRVAPRPDQYGGPSLTEPAQFPSDPGVQPSALTPGSGASPGSVYLPGPGLGPAGAVIAPASEPVPEGVAEGYGPMSNAEPAQAPAPRAPARRGLLGMLFQPRGD